MQVIRQEHPMPFDVDNTLVTQVGFNIGPSISILNPLTNTAHNYQIHQSHVRLLKEQFLRGRLVIVWSASGYAWAEAVVDALELKDFVHIVMSKPIAYVDDKDIVDWIGSRIFVNDGER